MKQLIETLGTVIGELEMLKLKHSALAQAVENSHPEIINDANEIFKKKQEELDFNSIKEKYNMNTKV
ncbi:hypothetical protein NRK67_00530 [Fusobacteria bacterium ZRK30]|nr:hypothetical protein NRK67_00530 [Fusobacteria bacterium ZRK30]